MKVTAIISTFNAERFFRARVANLLSQSIADQLEIIIIDSGSEQREADLFIEHFQQHENITYLRTARETLYAAWNRAANLARGAYLTNANCDDRLLNHGLETLANALDRSPQASLAYSDYWLTREESEIADQDQVSYKPGRVRVLQPEYSHYKLLLQCYCGPFPMWRRSLHERLGYFDPTYVVAGDWEFWLRAAEHSSFIHVPEPLGVMLQRDDSIFFGNHQTVLTENDRVRKKYFGSRREVPTSC